MAQEKYVDPIEKIRSVKIHLLLKKPFFASIITRLKLIETEQPGFHTMGVDGKHLYYNKEFIDAISHKQLIFVICHEVLHCAFEHFGRLNGRDRQIWNQATDYCINWILKRDGIGEMPTGIKIPSLPEPIVPCYDEKYKNLTSEEIYDMLIKSGAKPKQGFDVHIYVGKKKGDKDSDKDGKGKGGGLQKDKDGFSVSEEDGKAFAEDMRDAIIDAAQRYGGKEAGSCPAEITRMVKEFTEPKINWRQLITSSIQSHVKSDSSFVMPSKKSWSNGIGAIFPGRIPEPAIKVGCAIDVSGSISEEQIVDFVSEVKGIMEMYRGFEIHLWSFDTQCYSYKKFDQDTAEDLPDWQPQGGGGTCIAANWPFIDEMDMDIDHLIVFTDLCDSSQNSVDPDRIETIWIINNPYDKDIKPPFGAAAYYEK